MTDHTTRRRLGHVEQTPNGRWLARISCGINVDGSTRRASRTFDRKSDADAWIVAKAVEMKNEPMLGAGVTLSRLWDVYKQARLESLARKTAAGYKWHMEGKDGWIQLMGDVDASAITCAEVQRHIDSMPREKARHAKLVLSAVLSWGVAHDLLKSNPILGHRFSYPPRKIADFDDDPFAAIEGERNVWGVDDVLRCMDLIRGLPLEPCWLACAGAGLRVEEALALRKMDVRRIEVGGLMVTQLAVHAARTDMDERKETKTAHSVRVVAMMEPLGKRYWELVSAVSKRTDLVCPVSAANQNKRWRNYFAEPPTSKHAPKKRDYRHRGTLSELPYVPLSKMRNTHVTLMQMAGVSDSLNALMHGHSEQVEKRHYMKPDHVAVATNAGLKLVC